MLDTLLSYIAPHPCYGCAKIGTILCDYCKYNIINEPLGTCIACGDSVGSLGVCRVCSVPYSRAWCVGERSGVLQQLIGGLKFQNIYAAHKTLADLLLARLDQLPSETIIVPVPTVASHVRQRGYDHTLLIAKYIAKKRGLKLSRCLYRVTTSKQRDANRLQRMAQAKIAFSVDGCISNVPHLLIDDVVTTGATIQYAAMALKNAGASEVWVAVVARQPLD